MRLLPCFLIALASLAACSSSDGPAPFAVGPGSSSSSSSSSGGGASSSSGGGATNDGGTSTSTLQASQLCSVPDLENAPHGFGVSRIRVAADGSVFMLFNDALRHYTVDTTSASCTFTLDPAFTTTDDDDVSSFDFGPSGKILTKSFEALEVRDIATGALTYSCAGQGDGRLAMSSDGMTAYSLSSTSPSDSSMKFVLGATACTSEAAWTPTPPWATDATGYAESVIALADTIVVGAQESVLVYGLDGTQKLDFGHTGDPSDWTTFGLAYLNDLVVSSAGIDAVDSTSPSIHRYDSTGKFLKLWTITDLTGLPDNGSVGARPQALGIAPSGERYLAIDTGSKGEVYRLPAF